MAGIVIGFVTLALFLLFAGLWIAVCTTVHNSFNAASSEPVAQCQADIRSVEVAVDAFQAQKGSYADPPAAWSAGTYTSNYAPLTSATDGGPYLREPPTTNEYVIEYDSSGNVWVAQPNTFESSFEVNQGIAADSDACELAASG